MNTPWVESPLFYKNLEKKKLSDEQRQMAINFHENGYVILRKFASKDLVDQIQKDIQGEFPSKLDESPLRQQDLWQKYPSVKNLTTHPNILDALGFLYEKKPVPFQTLNFKYGSQQRLHSDTIHFSSIPARYMCGVWVALEDTNENNGPLLYCPGTNRLQEYFYSDIGIPSDYPGQGDGVEKGDGYKNYGKYEDFIEQLVSAKNYNIQELYLEKGDALIWASNLVHGGKKVLNPELTRWSQVMHYYFEDCTYYTPMWSNMHTGELFLRNIQNVATELHVPNMLNGKTINSINSGKNRFSLYEKFEAGLFSNLSWSEVWIGIKDKIKRQFFS
jgi:ectoine hydroxylase-related dioxygenase (phytanoyl-CoA dioxygenase family)